MSEYTPQLLRYGQEAPLPRFKRLRAGPLALEYGTADLRYIRLGDREVIRRMYFAVRDTQQRWLVQVPHKI